MKKRIISLFLVLVMITSVLVGCNKPATDESTSIKETATNLVEETKLVDMAGREIVIPEEVNTVFSTGAVGTILLYSLAPEKMAGWNYSLRESEKGFIDEKLHDLPNLGGAGKETVNLEELLKVNPDVLFSMGKIDATSISQIEEMEDQLGKQIIIIDDDINKLDEAYLLLGKVLGTEENAKKLGEYCRTVLDDVAKKSATITDDMKVGLYYAEGPDGLQSEPAGTMHASVIEMVGGKNVFQLETQEQGAVGKSEVSIEQVLEWDPEIIISWDDERGGYFSGIQEDPVWKDIKAVKNNEVYEIPNQPFNWFDRPPSVNRILGLQWLGNLLYPDIYDYNMEEVVKEFYSSFYHMDLTQAQLDQLFLNTIRK